VLEALACGVPVVASEVGGVPEQVEPGRTGFLVRPGDPAALAERIGWLLSDETLRRRFAAQAAQTARSRFDFNQQVDATLAWYRQILDLPAAERAERRAA
jgi:glycosyltransferase involved in cell wall biosynthesis